MTELEKLNIIIRWQATTFNIAFDRETRIFFFNLGALIRTVFIGIPLLALRSIYYLLFPIVWFLIYVPIGYFMGDTSEENMINTKIALDDIKSGKVILKISDEEDEKN